MLFAFAPIKWIAPIKTTRITASMIAYSPTPWPCSDRSLFKVKRPKLLTSRKSVGSMFTFSLHRQEWPNSGNPKGTTTGLTTVIKKPIRLGRRLGSPTVAVSNCRGFRNKKRDNTREPNRKNCKCLTNTPVRMAGSVLKCSDDYKNRVVSAQATYTSGSSATSG